MSTCLMYALHEEARSFAIKITSTMCDIRIGKVESTRRKYSLFSYKSELLNLNLMYFPKALKVRVKTFYLRQSAKCF